MTFFPDLGRTIFFFNSSSNPSILGIFKPGTINCQNKLRKSQTCNFEAYHRQKSKSPCLISDVDSESKYRNSKDLENIVLSRLSTRVYDAELEEDADDGSDTNNEDGDIEIEDLEQDDKHDDFDDLEDDGGGGSNDDDDMDNELDDIDLNDLDFEIECIPDTKICVHFPKSEKSSLVKTPKMMFFIFWGYPPKFSLWIGPGHT